MDTTAIHVNEPPEEDQPDTSSLHVEEQSRSGIDYFDRPTTGEDHHLIGSNLSYVVQNDFVAFTPPVSPDSQSFTKPGSYRYLKGSEIDDLSYEFAIVTYRESHENVINSPEKDGVEQRILESLIENGLQVDILEGGFSTIAKGKSKQSKYFVLLIRASDELLSGYARKLKVQTWLRSGNARELDSVIHDDVMMMNPADRIQIVDYIIREGAHLTVSSPNVHSIFPVHDERANKYLLKTFIQSRKLERISESFLSNLKTYFGEKVAYYFAFMDFYNKALLPIALLGLVLTCLRTTMGTRLYMQVLVFWSFLVSVVWSFWFLKAWTRRNKEINFYWKNDLETKTIVYRNPNFQGQPCINPITGLQDLFYPSWKRYPKYFCMGLFMFLQISIMMLIIALWITVFEILKVRYPDAGIFSAQWFYILGGGILFGLFVDIFQWNLIIMKAGRLFTEWENWKTIEQFEKSLVRKLFLMDFLNYYTWFFLLAFVYVIPGAGDTITNFLNTAFWKDPINCCFGPYLDRSGRFCLGCPAPWHSFGGSLASQQKENDFCVPCRGLVTFDRHHLNLEQLFLTPIIVTQGLNLLLAVMVPWIHRQHHEQSLKVTDRKAMKLVKEKGPRNIIADLQYRDDDHAVLVNMSKARYLENDDVQVERLNAKARNILFQSERDDYDPYDDYHHSTVQFGFVVMFSMLWPPMPLACMIINALKVRGDSFRLCTTLKRPFPRKAGGIGEWQHVLYVLACTGVIVNVGLIFMSTGAVEFFSDACTEHIQKNLGGKLTDFRFGPDFACFSITVRMIMILVTEHIVFALIWIFWKVLKSVPAWLDLDMLKQEYEFKHNLYRNATSLQQKKTANSMMNMNPINANTNNFFTSTSSSSNLASRSNSRLTEKRTSISDVRKSTTKNKARRGSLTMNSIRKSREGTKEEQQPLLSSRSLANAWESAAKTREESKEM